jgi:pantoate--beta-alanine ligase
MQIIYTVQEMRAISRQLQKESQTIGFIPTMGALHAGHLSLVNAARQRSDKVVVSIFVNPTQFGPNEDFSRYPRTLERDCELLKNEKVDFLFAPSTEEMYPAGSVTYVTVEGLSGKLDGGSRPGHFRGVATVVAKLFHIVQPDVAFFGQKDAAQVAIIRHIVRDLNFPVEIVACPIVREPDGLAMSSRNVYLSAAERKSALVLLRSLQEVKNLFERGERSPSILSAAGEKVLLTGSGVQLDYFSIVDPDTLDDAQHLNRPALVAVAAFVGKTRLIDNIVLTP